MARAGRTGTDEGIGRREIERASRRGRERTPLTLDPRRIALGAKGGLIATVVMTIFRMPITDSLPPTANFWAQYVSGGEPEDHALAGLLLHLAYGTGAGVLLAVLSPVLEGDTEVEQEWRGVLVGLVFGLLLSVFGERAILEGLLGMDPEPDERFIFHVGHVIYGLTLGAWAGSKVD